MRYSAVMRPRHPDLCPHLAQFWLLSDARNDAMLEAALLRLPPNSGLIFRHYHLNEAKRRERFDELSHIVRQRGLSLILSGSAATARQWGADGIYGSPAQLIRSPIGRSRGLIRLCTAHSLREIADAKRAGADAILLSPVFPTRSHPGARALGPTRFRLFARHTILPVIALGGMTLRNANRLNSPRWAAIDGLC